MKQFVQPDWPAPSRVRAYTTTRQGGVSKPPYDSFNLAMQPDEATEVTMENRRILRTSLRLPAEPLWCRHVHGCRTVVAGPELIADAPPQADASVCFDTHTVCVVTTADCLPVFFCDREGSRVGIAHAGWRGLAQGVLAATVKVLRVRPANLMAWLGPAIGPQAYQVGDEVRDVFLEQSTAYASAFLPDNTGYWMANLYALAHHQLKQMGIGWLGGGRTCTYYSRQFYSFRRNPTTGRMANLIWLSEPNDSHLQRKR